MEEDISNPQTGSTSVCDYVFGSLKLLVIDVIKPGSCRIDTWRISVRGKMLFFCSMPVLKSSRNPKHLILLSLKNLLCTPLPLLCEYKQGNKKTVLRYGYDLIFILIMCTIWEHVTFWRPEADENNKAPAKNQRNNLHFFFTSHSMSI